MDNQNTSFCPHCGTQLSGKPTFCPACGSRLTAPRSFCKNCGIELAGNPAFCTSCGAAQFSAPAPEIPVEPVVSVAPDVPVVPVVAEPPLAEKKFPLIPLIMVALAAGFIFIHQLILLIAPNISRDLICYLIDYTVIALLAVGLLKYKSKASMLFGIGLILASAYWILSLINILSRVSYSFSLGEYGKYLIKNLLLSTPLLACGITYLIQSPRLKIPKLICVGLWAFSELLNIYSLLLNMDSFFWVLDLSQICFSLFFTAPLIVATILYTPFQAKQS